ncbi:hypothetical protein ATANTOWER_011535 [Ataeniobius toweri]|uniref:Uncharacterized protein n=1 Tax=Ataeniobius toweri TaxID=208326 RepID=A0ABU7CJF3_9TELE|nr:hypothetical protein [Ataeniobius toweri]
MRIWLNAFLLIKTVRVRSVVGLSSMNFRRNESLQVKGSNIPAGFKCPDGRLQCEFPSKRNFLTVIKGDGNSVSPHFTGMTGTVERRVRKQESLTVNPGSVSVQIK